MTYFAVEGGVSQDASAGAVEITAEQYHAAIDGMVNGKVVTVAGGFAVIDPPAPPEPEPEPEPEPGIPDRVTSRQFMLQLEAAGLYDQVKAWIDAQPRAVQLAFQYSGTFVRDEPMMQSGFAALGFTPEQIDAFFTAAAAL